jgi:hypothetical protein
LLLFFTNVNKNGDKKELRGFLGGLYFKLSFEIEAV